MAKRNRPSVLKRQREAEKRQRQERKATKAAMKRERRESRSGQQTQIVVERDFGATAEEAGNQAPASDSGSSTSQST